MNSNFRPQGIKMLPDVVKNLLIINGLMFFATFVMDNTMGVDLTRILGLHYFSSEFFKPFQFITHIFMHGSLMHLFMNMFALWMFGNVLENHWGPQRFLIYYMATAFGAAGLHIFVTWFGVHGLEQGIEALRVSGTPEAFQYFITEHVPDGLKNQFVEVRSAWESSPGSSQLREQAYSYANQLYNMEINTPIVGASGAVFGLLLAFGMLFPNTLIYLYFAIPIKAKYFVALYGAFELYQGIANNPGDNVAHFAHLGGMLFGFILIKFWRSKGH